jgi:amino acid permease
MAIFFDNLVESEFWLAIGKVILIVGLIVFTFITMVGGNPLRDAYGFRSWNRELFRHYINNNGTLIQAFQQQKCQVHLSQSTSRRDRLGDF